MSDKEAHMTFFSCLSFCCALTYDLISKLEDCFFSYLRFWSRKIFSPFGVVPNGFVFWEASSLGFVDY